jgi:hypothetical protein
VPGLDRRELARQLELFLAVVADGLQRAIAGRRTALDDEQAVVGQPSQPVGYHRTVDVRGCDGVCGVDVEPGREDGNAPQQRLVGGIEQAVAPGDRVPDRTMPAGNRRAADVQEAQPLVQAGLQPVEAEGRVPGRGQFDRQGHAVQRLAERAQATRIREVLAGCLAGAGKEQRHRVAVDGQPRHRVETLVGKQKSGAAGRQHGDAGTAGDDRLDAGAHGLHEVLAVVQHEQPVARRQRGDQAASREAACCCGTPTASATAATTVAGSVTRTRSTNHAPSRRSAARPVATLIARRVLPTPPGPTAVTSRCSARSRASATRSVARPMNGVTGTGRAPRPGMRSTAALRARVRRSGACSFRNKAATLLSTVRTEMLSVSAICAFVRCWPISVNTSASRAVTAVPAVTTRQVCLYGALWVGRLSVVGIGGGSGCAPTAVGATVGISPSHSRRPTMLTHDYSYATCLDGSVHAFVEEYIVPMVLANATRDVYGDETRLWALVRFAEEEVKHQEMLRRACEQFEQGFGTPCGLIPGREAVAEVVLATSPLTALLLTSMIEWFTQLHYVEHVRDGDELDRLFRDILRYHWIDESRHARLDSMLIDEVAEGLPPEERERAIDELLELGGAIDGLLAQQVELDIEALALRTGRSFTDGETSEIRSAQQRGYRWTFLVSGLEHPKFTQIVAELTTAGSAKLTAASTALSAPT